MPWHKKRNPFYPGLNTVVLKPGFIERRMDLCGKVRWLDAGDCDRAAMESIRDRVVQEHIDGMNFDDKIINELTGKAKCVYEKLKRKMATFLKRQIGEFIDNPDYHLQLNSGVNVQQEQMHVPTGTT